jgi:hypothetical protein
MGAEAASIKGEKGRYWSCRTTAAGARMKRPSKFPLLSEYGYWKRKRGAKRKPDNPAQSARFIKAAKELGVDESGKDFEEAMRAVARSRKPKRQGN